MSNRKDTYGNELQIGDFVIKAAQNTPDYAIIVDFVDNVGAKGTAYEYHWETVRIASNKQKPGNTHADRLLLVQPGQLPHEVHAKLMLDYAIYQTGTKIKGSKGK